MASDYFLSMPVFGFYILRYTMGHNKRAFSFYLYNTVINMRYL